MSALLRIAALFVCAGYLLSAYAHLISAQRGTLNIVDGGGFLMLSLPVSAFEGLDEDGDGKVSLAELRTHYGKVEQAVLQNVRLFDGGGQFPLEGLMLTLSHSHDLPGASAADQLVVMGRFALRPGSGPMALHVGLYGKAGTEQALEVTVTRGTDRQRLRFIPENRGQILFPVTPP